MTPTKAQRVIAAHYGLSPSPAQVVAEVLNCKRKAVKLSECDTARSLRVRLELAYGVPIEEIAFHAEANWPQT
jgi:hypothetical protein